MSVGRVVRFDETRGYGFIAPDDGGEDVFVHANELINRGVRVATGARVTFEVVDGERGPKAYQVRVMTDGPEPAATEPTTRSDGDDDLFEVFPEQEFLHQMTELMLAAAPQLTGAQIRDVRAELLRFARTHGWVE